MTFKSIRSDALKSHDERQKMYAHGGRVHADEAEDRELVKEMVKKKDLKPGAKDGGKIEGRARGGRSDRPRAKTTVNVIMPPGAPAGAAPMMARPPMPAGPPPQMALPPPRPPMPQPGMGPMGPPPGGGGMPPPGMMPHKSGGKVSHRDMGGPLPGQPMPPQQMPMRPNMPGQPGMPIAAQKNGGKVKRAAGGRMDAGAMSGEGRMEKAEGGIKGKMIGQRYTRHDQIPGVDFGSES